MDEDGSETASIIDHGSCWMLVHGGMWNPSSRKVARSYVISGLLPAIFARSSSLITMTILVVLERSRMFTLRSWLLFFCLLAVSQAWVSPLSVAQRPSWTPLEATEDPSSTRTTSLLESSAWV